MPYFKWVGIDITGTIKRGKHVACSSQDLSEKLLKRGIALLHDKIMYAPSFFWPINAKLKVDLFQQKAKLLQAGLLLPKVLEIVAQQSYNPIVYDMLSQVSRDVQQGVSFAKALEKHHKLCDSIVVVMLNAGHESGNIISAMENVALYFYKQDIFYKRIRSALAMPLLTLLFFLGISVFIFIFIIPRFADMFSSLQQELPSITRTMIQLSDFMCSFSMMYVAGGLTIIFLIAYYYGKNVGKQSRDTFIARMPFIGNVVWQYHMSQALQAMALLVNSGVTLAAALKVVSDSVDHYMVKSQFMALYDDVVSGQLLSAAMATTTIFLPEITALVHLGEETGTLGQSLENAAAVYNSRLEDQLRRFVFFLQPTVIIILGFLVTILIFAVYLPIIQLSYVL